jgi:hypothetical protein
MSAMEMWFMTLWNQDEDSEKEIDKMTEAPKGTGNEVEFWGDFRMGGYILMECNMI